MKTWENEYKCTEDLVIDCPAELLEDGVLMVVFHAVWKPLKFKEWLVEQKFFCYLYSKGIEGQRNDDMAMFDVQVLF